MNIQDSYKGVFSEIDRVMVVMAHPDDTEIVCGGLVARLIEDGKKVRIIVVTNGGKGYQDRTDVTEAEFAVHRKKCQLRAELALGVPENENINLDIPDGEVENSVELIGKLAFNIRQFKPDILITHNPEEMINSFDGDTRWVNHRDHRNTALSTVDAAYPYSRDRGFFPEHFKTEGVHPHTVTTFMFSDSYTHPELKYFDVTNQIEMKRNALTCHKGPLTDDEIDGFVTEIEHENGSFEPLRIVRTD